MAKTTSTNISIRMDADLKAAAEELFADLGMNISTAFNIFVTIDSYILISINIILLW